MILKEGIKERLRQIGVFALYLFGSRASGFSRADSDFDFAVLVKDPLALKTAVGREILYSALYDVLTDAIAPQTTDPVLDIVFLQRDISLELKAHVISKGKILMDEDPNTRANEESYIMIRMADMQPVLAKMDKAILERI